ncbi:hypothetical protein [Parvularcula dongshanensis]|uniref:Uncharacterized protein n=1 Tax=Parvularcula dongshanensis TaxID=1173995 RepID=A0A840I7A5_9PROT|nr:hypothetical protein [Parvularcula dongshanensis]MBB4660392.1 hypothetical protein [Parvularcula dongshanensis]
MGKPEEWVGTARLVKAFDTDVLRMTGLLAPALRAGLLGLTDLRAYRWRGAAIRRKINN